MESYFFCGTEVFSEFVRMFESKQWNRDGRDFSIDEVISIRSHVIYK